MAPSDQVGIHSDRSHGQPIISKRHAGKNFHRRPFAPHSGEVWWKLVGIVDQGRRPSSQLSFFHPFSNESPWRKPVGQSMSSGCSVSRYNPITFLHVQRHGHDREQAHGLEEVVMQRLCPADTRNLRRTRVLQLAVGHSDATSAQRTKGAGEAPLAQRPLQRLTPWSKLTQKPCHTP